MATNIPQLSDAERKAALEKAKEARIKRAEVRDRVQHTISGCDCDSCNHEHEEN